MKIQLRRHELSDPFENESGVYGVVYGSRQIRSMYIICCKGIYYHDELHTWKCTYAILLSFSNNLSPS